MRKSVDEILTEGHLLYGISMTGVFVETLLDRATGDDVAEAEAAIARLAAAPAEGRSSETSGCCVCARCSPAPAATRLATAITGTAIGRQPRRTASKGTCSGPRQCRDP